MAMRSQAQLTCRNCKYLIYRLILLLYLFWDVCRTDYEAQNYKKYSGFPNKNAIFQNTLLMYVCGCRCFFCHKTGMTYIFEPTPDANIARFLEQALN